MVNSFSSVVKLVGVYVCITVYLLTVRGQGKLEKLEEQFEHIELDRLQYPKPGMVCIALVKTDMEDGSSEDVYLRARVQEIRENEVSISLLVLPVCC